MDRTGRGLESILEYVFTFRRGGGWRLLFREGGVCGLGLRVWGLGGKGFREHCKHSQSNCCPNMNRTCSNFQSRCEVPR